jgi:hypothetical protein
MDLERRACSGDRAAQVALGLTLEGEGRHEAARVWLARAAQQGDAEALTALGINLLVRAPQKPFEGTKAIVDAANAGGARAIHLAGAMAAAGAGLPQSWPMALACLEQSAARGWTRAQDELRLLARSSDGPWTRLCDSIDIAALLALPDIVTLRESPRIQVAKRFLTAETCNWLIARAGPRVNRALVFDAAAHGTVDPGRNNSAVEFDITECDLVLALVRARIAAAVGLPANGFEHSQVLHYATGQRFAPHYDFLEPLTPAHAENIAAGGQRVATFLIYLNDDFDGAETAFLSLDWRHRGAKGDALLFWNVDPAGAIDRTTLHAGLAPLRGEKWLFSQWIRARVL